MASIKIIAEIGINHDGIEDRAKQLIDMASQSGVHAVKFQYRNLKNIYSDTAREIGDEILLNEINKNYLSPDQIYNLSVYSKTLGLEVGVSFFDENDILDFGSNIKIFDYFKVPSVELTNTSLIDALILLGRHVYISTGGHNESEICDAFNRLPEAGWTPMHCISNYPVAIQNSRLGYISHLKIKWKRNVGYSSHDDCWEVCLLAMQLGVTVIERHITLDCKAEGLDHSTSSTPDHFKKISMFGENIKTILSGDSSRVANQGELLNRQNLGRSYFSIEDLPVGHILQASDLVYRSPNIGLNKTNIKKYLSKPIQAHVNKGDSLTDSDFQNNIVLSSSVVEFARRAKLSLPVRLHDLENMEKYFPIGSFEFHLSFGEILTDIDVKKINHSNNYSIHLPDYINSTQLMDPFSKNSNHRQESINILERTVNFAESLQDLTGTTVPVVGSFSIVHTNREEFFAKYDSLFKSYLSRGVLVLPQWLPPIAWYFGGSVDLHVMNDIEDAQFLKKYDISFCMDICHLILGRNYFDFSADSMVDTLSNQVRHVHIADAAGIDGEGLAFGEGEPENIALIRKMLEYDCFKVIEVWQGHFNQGAGFRTALHKLAEIYNYD